MAIEIEKYTIPRVIGIKQAAAEFGIAEYALRAWIKSGQLPVISCGRKHLINCTVLSRFLSGELTGSAGEPEQIKPVAIGGNSELYTKTAAKTAKSGKNKLYKVMPPIR